MAKHVVRMGLEDAEHYTEAQKDAIRASYPPHERDAREKGIPILGSGAVYPVPRAAIEVTPFAVPDYWFEIGGLDVGWDHPTAAVRMVWDQEADVAYITHCYRQSKKTPLEHAEVLKGWGKNLPWAWPHDALSHGKDGSKPLRDQYRKHGLRMLDGFAAFESGSTAVEAGVMLLLEEMQVGKLKVFATCGDWFEEQALYHRKDGKIVDELDDLMDATRYARVMRRHSSQVGRVRNRRRWETAIMED